MNKVSNYLDNAINNFVGAVKEFYEDCKMLKKVGVVPAMMPGNHAYEDITKEVRRFKDLSDRELLVLYNKTDAKMRILEKTVIVVGIIALVISGIGALTGGCMLPVGIGLLAVTAGIWLAAMVFHSKMREMKEEAKLRGLDFVEATPKSPKTTFDDKGNVIIIA